MSRPELGAQSPDAAPVLSFVIPFYNEAPNVESLYRRLCAVMDHRSESWECVCVNDGSGGASGISCNVL
ncbi:MAG: glycosyltransferase [Gammaproteobacteria bacterium]|nr:glycosyltransferase [Gammaproteobacteria bacterium]